MIIFNTNTPEKIKLFLRNSSVNVIKSTVLCGLFTLTKEICAVKQRYRMESVFGFCSIIQFPSA